MIKRKIIVIFARFIKYKMKKFTNIFFAFCSIASLFVSCDDKEHNVEVSVEKFPIGTVTWSGEVSAQDKAVISELLNNMVHVEATHFYMGAQSKSYTRANYISGYTAGKDTIFNKNKANLEDTLYTDDVKIPYCLVYYNAGLAVGPVFDITMPDYFIGKYEVTQGQWMAVVGHKPSGTYCKVEELKGTDAWYDATGKGDNIAAYNISYDDALEFCASLSRKTGLKFRLPTEAEWECAARGGKATKGYKNPGSDTYLDIAWCYSNACDVGLGATNYGVHAGGELLTNELGIYDMAGNVSEWVANSYYRYTLNDNTNPQGAARTDTLVLRGGSWTQSRALDFSPATRKKFIESSYSKQSYLDAIAYCGLRIAISK